MQDSTLLMCKGEATKPTANNGLLPLLWTGKACVVSWFPTGSVGDSVLKCVHAVAGDNFLCWHSIFFSAFSLKTGLVLLSDWTWVGVEWIRAKLTIDYLFICFYNNCRYIFFPPPSFSRAWRTRVLYCLCSLFIPRSRFTILLLDQHLGQTLLSVQTSGQICVTYFTSQDNYNMQHLKV